MKLFLSAFLFVIFAPTADAFLWGLLTPLLEFFLAPFIALAAPSICKAGVTALALDQVLDCGCDGGFGPSGISGTVDCGLMEPVCMGPGETLCAQTEFDATFVAGGEGISGEISGCLAFETGLPPFLESFADVPSPLCITAQAVGLALSGCQVTLGGGENNECSCEICSPADDGGYFKYNCSGIDLAPGLPVFVAGPSSNGVCLGLAFNGGDAEE